MRRRFREDITSITEAFAAWRRALKYWPILRDGEFDEFVIGMAA